jgi:hypothetical protein
MQGGHAYRHQLIAQIGHHIQAKCLDRFQVVPETFEP